MLGAFVQENPLLVAIAGTIAIALVVLLAGTVAARLFGRRRRASLPRAQAADGGYAADWGRVEEAVPAPPPAAEPRIRRTGFGFGVVMVAFLVGVLLGGAGLAVSSRSVATAVSSLVASVEPSAPGPVAADSVETRPPSRPEPSPSVATPTPSEVRAELATFAERLKSSLPRAAGPEMSLTRVDLDGMRLRLGYAVARVMAEDEAKAFDAYIMRTVKSLFCGRDSREIRFLSENGAVFDMEYVDPVGQTVAKLTVEPGFCA